MELTLLEHLPPEARFILGISAAGLTLIGLLLWATGVKIARASVALLLGLIAATLCALLIPKFIAINVLSAAIVGFIIGSLVGLAGFRILQGLTFAACLGLGVAGLYFQWHVPRTAEASPTTLRAVDLLIPTHQLHPEKATAPAQGAPRVDLPAAFQSLGDRIAAIPAPHQHRLAIVGVGTAAVALLVSFAFPWFTTWLITATLGSLLTLAGGFTLVSLYAKPLAAYLPDAAIPKYLLLAFILLLGLLIQYRLFPPPADTSQKKTEQAPAQ